MPPELNPPDPHDPDRRRPTILHHELVLAAQARSGECLSSPAEAHARPGQVRWCCRAGHEFVAARHLIVRRGAWCPRCLGPAASRGSLRERVVRAFFESLFGRPFPRVRPRWTTELDGFNAELSVAFEHQGRQHFTWLRRFHRTKGAFKAQRRRDRAKVAACRERGILLIVIPSLYDLLPEADLRAFIRRACERRSRADLLPADFDRRQIDLTSAFCPDYAQDFAWLCSEAEDAGARIEEAGWLGDDYPYHFVCMTPGCGRRWRRTATSFRHRRGRAGERAGCACCSARRGAVHQRKELAVLLDLARERDVSVLSSPEEIYAGPDARCTLRCDACVAAGRTEEEATWTVTRAVLTKGIYGCATCAGKAALTPAEVTRRVALQGWSLDAPLPGATLTCRTKVVLRCTQGHSFQKQVRALAQGGCPSCYTSSKRGGNSTRRLTQAVAEDMARTLGWRLLSAYTNNKTKLRYACLGCGAEVTRTHNGLGAAPCPRCGGHGAGNDP